ncbi:hypothetical protein JCM13664_07270 [Methylothermus subterraneus]
MKKLILAFLVLLQSACTLAPPPQVARRPALPAPTKRTPPVAKSYPLPEPPSPPPARPYSPPPPPSPPPAAVASPPPAVIALTRQAELDRRQGNLDQAAARLERALRIQPQNAELWHSLAQIRLEQHQPRLAEELAKKSISLAGGAREILRRNWQLIAEARRISGDLPGARLAEQEAGRY